MAAPTIVGTLLSKQRLAVNSNPYVTFTPPTTGPDAILPGDIMVVFLASQANTSTSPNLILAGWTAITPRIAAANSFAYAAFAKVRVAGETSYSFAGSGSSTLISSNIRMVWFRGASADVADIISTAANNRAASSAAVVSPTITTTAADSLVVAWGGDRRPAGPYSGLTSVDNGFTNVYNDLEEDIVAASTAGSAQLAISTKVQSTPGAVGDTTHIFAGTAGTSGGAATFALKPLAGATPSSPWGFVSDFTKSVLRVGLKLSNATGVRVTATPSAGGTAIVGSAGVVSASGWSRAEVGGLAAGTDYDLVVEGQLSGSWSTVSTFLNIRTLTDVPEAFKVLSGSCQGHTSGYAVTAYNQMATEGAQFFTHQGDLHYADASLEADWRAAVEASLSKGPMKAFLQTTPMTWHWDNHDWGGNDSWKDSPVKNFAPAAIRELIPASVFPDSVGVYGKWKHANIQFIETDQWALRDHADDSSTYTNQLIASDIFDYVKPVGDATVGWIRTTSGERWSTDGVSTVQPTLGGGQGLHVVASGGYCFPKLADVLGTDLDQTVTLSVDKLPVGSTATVGLARSTVGAANRYLGVISLATTGVMTLRAMIGGTVLGSFTGATYVPGEKWHVRFKTTLGAGNTQLQVRLWKDGTAEPGTWQIDVTDTTADVQGASSPGVYTAIGSVSNGPITAAYDDYLVTGTAVSGSTDFKNGKSLLGAAQRAWLLDALASSKSPLIVWFCSFPLYSNWTGNGRWGDFREEADFIWKWLNARPWIKRRIVCVGGDSHNVAADDGTNTMWGLPSLNASPIDRTGEGGGTMSTTWNLANVAVDVSVGAYSRLTFTPVAGGGVDFRWDAVSGAGALVGSPFIRRYEPYPDQFVGANHVDAVFVGANQVW